MSEKTKEIVLKAIDLKDIAKKRRIVKKEKDQKKEQKSQTINFFEDKFIILQEKILKLGTQIQKIGQETETRSKAFKSKRALNRS